MNSRSTIDWSEVRRRLEESERRLNAILNPSAESAQAKLAQRAVDLRNRAVQQRAAEEQKVLVFRAGADRLAIALTSVREIVPVSHCTAVPGVPRNLVGVHSVRGIIHSLLDPRADDGRSPEDSPSATRYALLLRHPTLSIGIAATEIETISAVPPGALRSGELLSIGGTLARIVDSSHLTQALKLPAKNSE